VVTGRRRASRLRWRFTARRVSVNDRKLNYRESRGCSVSVDFDHQGTSKLGWNEPLPRPGLFSGVMPSRSGSRNDALEVGGRSHPARLWRERGCRPVDSHAVDAVGGMPAAWCIYCGCAGSPFRNYGGARATFPPPTAPAPQHFRRRRHDGKTFESARGRWRQLPGIPHRHFGSANTRTSVCQSPRRVARQNAAIHNRLRRLRQALLRGRH